MLTFDEQLEVIARIAAGHLVIKQIIAMSPEKRRKSERDLIALLRRELETLEECLNDERAESEK